MLFRSDDGPDRRPGVPWEYPSSSLRPGRTTPSAPCGLVQGARRSLAYVRLQGYFKHGRASPKKAVFYSLLVSSLGLQIHTREGGGFARGGRENLSG